MQALHKLSSHSTTKSRQFGPFNSHVQTRFRKKPTTTAQTRLETRTLDSQLDKLSDNLKSLKIILNLHELIITRKRGPYISLQLTSRFKNDAGLNPDNKVGKFIRKYPHVFEVFTHPLKKNLCCRMREGFVKLVEEERNLVRERIEEGVLRVKKSVMMSANRGVGIKGLVLLRREFGLPEDFRELVLGREGVFRVVNVDRVELMGNLDEEEGLGIAAVEKWREREFKEKWLSEFEVKYAFPINYPTGFKIVAGFRGKLRDWQRMPYLKPYDRKGRGEGSLKVRTCGGVERYEKRAVAVIHELLSLTVEKMVEVERLSHFRKDLGIEVNIRELLLKHPGIFYISTKGGTQTVFLREAYRRGCLIEPNPIYEVRRKMLDLVLLGRRNTRELKMEKGDEERDSMVSNENMGGEEEGSCVSPMLDGFEGGWTDGESSEEEANGITKGVKLRDLYE